jgi:hypothetical protein
MQMRKINISAKSRLLLTRIFVICGCFIAILAVASGYLLQTYADIEYWSIIKFQTNSGMLLGILLVSVAVCLRSCNRRWIEIACISLGALLLAVSGSLIINSTAAFMTKVNELQATPPPKYLFRTDWVTRNAENWSKYLAPFRGKPGVHALEIGSFEGRSTFWFLEHILTHPTSTITCVDIFPEPSVTIFDRNVEASGLKNKIFKLTGYSKDVLRTLPVNSYDFVYIDGSHVAMDVLTAYSAQFGQRFRVKPAGDSGAKRPGLIGAKRRWSFFS